MYQVKHYQYCQLYFFLDNFPRHSTPQTPHSQCHHPQHITTAGVELISEPELALVESPSHVWSNYIQFSTLKSNLYQNAYHSVVKPAMAPIPIHKAKMQHAGHDMAEVAWGVPRGCLVQCDAEALPGEHLNAYKRRIKFGRYCVIWYHSTGSRQF